MSSVGYGDISPRTPVGRFVAIGIAVGGCVIMSLTVVALAGFFHFDYNQEKAYCSLISYRLAAHSVM